MTPWGTPVGRGKKKRCYMFAQMPRITKSVIIDPLLAEKFSEMPFDEDTILIVGSDLAIQKLDLSAPKARARSPDNSFVH